MKKSSFSISTPEQSPGFLLWQVTTLWQREIKSALEPLHLSHSAFVILASLLWFKEQKSEVTQTTIIEHSKLDKMTVSKSLKALEQKKLLHRKEHPIDTRAKSIMISKSGEKLAKEALKLVEAVDAKFFALLDGKECKELNQLFGKLLNRNL